MSGRRSGNPAKTGWDPLVVRQPVNPATPMAQKFEQSNGLLHHYNYRTPMLATECWAFGNRLYDGIALTFLDESMHLSFKRKDRTAVRDWRHFQAIKNEVAGPDREAIEIFPPESQLYDAANEYHLWVLPPGQQSSLGMAVPTDEPAVIPPYDQMDNASYRQGGAPGARQRPWEAGIPTGLGDNSPAARIARGLEPIRPARRKSG
jgi:hypothetical protein